MASKIKILIADDHAILRHGLRLLIDGQADMEVVAEAVDGQEAIDLARETQPDVALMDLTMPVLGGVQAIERIRKVSPRTRLLALTMHDDQSYLRSVIAAGGVGYVVKRAVHDELLSAIRSVYKGRSYIGVSIAEGGLQDVTSSELEERKTLMETSPLSKRERDVLREVAYGYTNKQIATRLGISLKTVETYRSRFKDKLGMKHRADLVRYALELGLIGEER